MKNKVTIASSVLSLLTIATHASAISAPEGWYLKASYENVYSSPTYNNLSILGGSIGYKRGYFRSEAQLSYAHIYYTYYDYYNYGEFEGNSYTIGLHSFFDFDNNTIFSPYAGIGIERMILTSDYYASESDVYAVGLLGVRAKMTNNLSLDLGYKTDLEFLGDGGVVSIGMVYHFN